MERHLGQDVAWAASCRFLIDPNKSPQGAYAAFSTQKDHADEPILRAQEIIEGEVGRPTAVDELARRVSLSRRTFVRRFRTATGDSPRSYIQRVRIEAAKRALERGDGVAGGRRAGGLRRRRRVQKLFVRLAGPTPAEYRSRYGPRVAPAWERARRASS